MKAVVSQIDEEAARAVASVCVVGLPALEGRPPIPSVGSVSRAGADPCPPDGCGGPTGPSGPDPGQNNGGGNNNYRPPGRGGQAPASPGPVPGTQNGPLGPNPMNGTPGPGNLGAQQQPTGPAQAGTNATPYDQDPDAVPPNFDANNTLPEHGYQPVDRPGFPGPQQPAQQQPQQPEEQRDMNSKPNRDKTTESSCEYGYGSSSGTPGIPCDYKFDPNDKTGLHDYCTAPMDSFMGADFRPACARHDMCYTMARANHVGLQGCNNWLQEDMDKVCEARFT